MKPETKLALRRWTIRQLRKLLDFLDDRLHAAEVSLREELSCEPEAHKKREHHLATDHRLAVSSGTPGHDSPEKNQADTEKSVMAQARPLRASGRQLTRRRGKTAAEFDLSLASRSMPLRFSR